MLRCLMMTERGTGDAFTADCTPVPPIHWFRSTVFVRSTNKKNFYKKKLADSTARGRCHVGSGLRGVSVFYKPSYPFSLSTPLSHETHIEKHLRHSGVPWPGPYFGDPEPRDTPLARWPGGRRERCPVGARVATRCPVKPSYRANYTKV